MSFATKSCGNELMLEGFAVTIHTKSTMKRNIFGWKSKLLAAIILSSTVFCVRPAQALIVGALIKEPAIFIAGAGLIGVGIGQSIYYGTRPLQYYMDRKAGELLNSVDGKQTTCDEAFLKKERRKHVLLGLGFVAAGILADEKSGGVEQYSIATVLRRKVQSGEISQDTANKINIDLSEHKIKIRVNPKNRNGSAKSAEQMRTDLEASLSKQRISPETKSFLVDFWMPKEI